MELSMREVGSGSPMAEPQSREFLKRESVGTLAISTSEMSPPYNIPMAYAYNGITPIVFQFIVHPESEKMEYIKTGSNATLTVIDHEKGGWISCMVQGTLSRVEEDKRSTAETTFENHGPDFEIDLFHPRDDYHVEYWNLLEDEIHGRHRGSHPFPV
jgi:nitroimidazol reductase NimA-like FMN-containing flavoprotein (pyridoxamine 5'-phosphate oxidase superfamily)